MLNRFSCNNLLITCDITNTPIIFYRNSHQYFCQVIWFFLCCRSTLNPIFHLQWIDWIINKIIRSLPSGLVKRSSIVLLASQGELNQNIAQQVGLHYNNVTTWCSWFLAALPALRKIEMDDPESFARKVNEICDLYQSALEHKYPDKLPLPGQCAKMEFEYIRHGATSLIGFFDVATGRMEMPYLNSTRTEEDFVEAVKALVETDPLCLYSETQFLDEPDRDMVWHH